MVTPVRPRQATPPPRARQRLDALVHARNLAPSRAQAQALIMAGRIHVDGQPCTKPGTSVAEASALRRIGDGPRFVGRAGAKLEAALDAFHIDAAGRVALDVGSSTGGFTDCLLQYGAARVHAVDCGTNQMDWRLRRHPRVHLRERTNARYLRPDDIGEPVTLMTVDVSFISVRKLLPSLAKLPAVGADIVILIKPQFESGREGVGDGGIVRDAAVREQAVRTVSEAVRAHGWDVLGVIPCPLPGAEGNQEYLLHARAGPGPRPEVR